MKAFEGGKKSGLVRRDAGCNSNAMSDDQQQQPQLAGGVFLALGTVGGVLIGAAMGQPSIGFLAGLAAGLAAATLVWLLRR